jgi:hypothetical protein
MVRASSRSLMPSLIPSPNPRDLCISTEILMHLKNWLLDHSSVFAANRYASTGDSAGCRFHTRPATAYILKWFYGQHIVTSRADLPRHAGIAKPTICFRGHPFDRVCRLHGIDHRLTWPKASLDQLTGRTVTPRRSLCWPGQKSQAVR